MRSITFKIKGFQSCENHYKSSVFLNRLVSKLLYLNGKKNNIKYRTLLLTVAKLNLNFNTFVTSYILQIQEVIRSRLLYSQSTHILINFKINSVF